MSYLDETIVAADEGTREPRQRRLIRAQMFSDRLPAMDILIRNISCRGIGAASRSLPPMKGEWVSVLLPHHEDITGVIRWVEGLSFGIALDRELDPQALADTIHRQNEMASASTNWDVKRLHRVATQSVDPSRLRRV